MIWSTDQRDRDNKYKSKFDGYPIENNNGLINSFATGECKKAKKEKL